MPDILNKYFDQLEDKLLKKLDTKINDAIYSPSKNDINSFRAIISQGGGPGRSNQFVFNIPLPQFLQQSIIQDPSITNILSTQGLNVFSDSIGLLCKEVTPPAKKFNISDVAINGQHRRVPQNYSWDTITATFYDTNSQFVYNTFYQWMDGINNPITNVGRFYDDYIVDLRLDYLTKSNDIAGYIKLAEAFPISVERSGLSYTSDNSVILTSVTFTYLYQTNKDYSSLMLYNILNNVTDGTASTLLNKAKNTLSQFKPDDWIKNSLKSKSSYKSTKGDYRLFSSPK